MISFETPGGGQVELVHLLLDVNGTLTTAGELLPDIAPRIDSLKQLLEIRLVSADTFGTLERIGTTLGVQTAPVPDGAAKLDLLQRLGADRAVHIGNGANDAAALHHAALGLAVLGPEGLSTAALLAADAVFASTSEALDALIDPRRLTATLRS